MKGEHMESREEQHSKPKEWKKIINHPDLEIYMPSRITVIGFLIAWLFVILIIVGTMVIARIGA
jgi:hypothetical protein